jgi:hypothetical protein
VAEVVVLILGNIAFQVLAERRNPPIGVFIECDGVRLHYIERGDAAAPCVVLFHGNGTMIQDLILSGLVDGLARYATGKGEPVRVRMHQPVGMYGLARHPFS